MAYLQTMQVRKLFQKSFYESLILHTSSKKIHQTKAV